jgi:hypothetical protein
MAKACCAECGKGGEEMVSTRKPKTFCSSACRMAHTNRRRERGAELYDLFMALRYERELANKLGVWTMICKLAAEWVAEDARERGGRKSWGNWRKWIEVNGVRLSAIVVGAPGGRWNWNGLRKSTLGKGTNQ